MFELSTKAYNYCVTSHINQTRRNGEPYAQRPLRVAGIMMQEKEGEKLDRLLSIAFLHDILEYGEISYQTLVEEFGEAVANCVLELTSNGSKVAKLGKEEYLKELMLELSEEALGVKLGIMLDDVSNIYEVKYAKRVEKAQEIKSVIINLIDNRSLTIMQKNLILQINNKIDEVMS